MSKNVLIVEDYLPTASALAYILKREGCEVRSVCSGEAALLAVKERVPDVISLDVHLSGLVDGYQVLEQIKAMPAAAATRVVLVTNLGLQHEIEKGKASGAADYLVKSEVTIHEIVNRLLEVA